MELDFFWLAVGIAIAGYCIGDGLKNFKNPNAKDWMDYLDEEEKHELIPEKYIHHYIGISKEDVAALIEEHPDIPHVQINGKKYFQKKKLRDWLAALVDE